ncbi:LysR family transcriptional regulator [Salinarimonas soli]|uniref:LysR family transcriptional regulator n=1 Tax=Salinarimonas soli TaxID=1638099 RepID=A0A5B2W0Y3_9HYPH|nr:LysR family transcriptional regulator [Salinarimonas soli]KAA2244067.1 LysR family transcriptional regulator [Salinarimonas soli]
MAFLNYHHLRYFWMIASEGSLTRAAQRLNVSASSLSVQLKALEDQLGQQLFERRGRALQLTEAGRIALGYAETMFRSGEELVSILKGLGRENRQVLRIGAVATLSRNFQLGILRPLISRPDVELVVRSGAFGDLLAQLEAHALDLVLANQPATIDLDADWQNTLVADQPVSLVGRPDDGTAPLDFPRDLARIPIVLPGSGSTIRTAFDSLLDEAGIRPIVLAEVDDMAMLRLIARESHAVTLVPPVVVIEELTAGVLVERCSLPQIKESFYAISRRRRFPNPLLREIAAAG